MMTKKIRMRRQVSRERSMTEEKITAIIEKKYFSLIVKKRIS